MQHRSNLFHATLLVFATLFTSLLHGEPTISSSQTISSNFSVQSNATKECDSTTVRTDKTRLVLGIVGTIIVNIAPLWQIRDIWWRHEYEGVSAITSVLCIAGLAVWFSYGALVLDIPFMISTSFGVMTQVVILTGLLYHRHFRKNSDVSAKPIVITV